MNKGLLGVGRPMTVSEARYLKLVLEDPDTKWELVDGHLRKKPAMTWEHGHTARNLAFVPSAQLDRSRWEVVHDSGRVRRSAENYVVPDVYVVPMEYIRRTFTRPGMVEAYPEPVPLVVDVWSRRTGRYDVTDKLVEYKRRGDLEVWLLHLYERTLTGWRRQPDGSYVETRFHGGTVQPIGLPNVTIDLDTLFD